MSSSLAIPPVGTLRNLVISAARGCWCHQPSTLEGEMVRADVGGGTMNLQQSLGHLGTWLQSSWLVLSTYHVGQTCGRLVF